jgi:hypothetical protein
MSKPTNKTKKANKSFPLAWVLLGGALIVGVVLASALPLFAPRAAPLGIEGGLQRGRAADTARYSAMAEYFAARSGTGSARGRAAEAVRLNAMAQFVLAGRLADLQQGRLAESARLDAAATHFGVDMGLQRGREADTARLDAAAEHFSAQQAADLQRGRAADAARLDAAAGIPTPQP